MLKIILFENGPITPDDQFISDATEISDWFKKVLEESSETKLFVFEEHKNSELLKIIQTNVPEITVVFVDEKSIPSETQKDTSRIICGIICDKDKIFATQIVEGASIAIANLSAYARMRRLAEHINNWN